jgi:hypothetical protein
VELYISVDGTGSTYEYIRYPAKWDETQKSVLAIKDFFSDAPNVHIYISPTYQVLNVLNLSELYRWCDSMGLDWVADNFVTDPTFHNAAILPPTIREEAAQRLENYFKTKSHPSFRQSYGIPHVLNHLRSKVDTDLNEIRNFDNHSTIMDRIRGQKLSDYCPELFHRLTQQLPSIFRATEFDRGAEISN